MKHIEDLVPLLAIHRLVPEVYADYRPLVSDAVVFFLNRLPREARTAILAEQAALPEETPAEYRAYRVMLACPTLHKLGQVLARHEALDGALRDTLQQLEFGIPTVAPDALEARVVKALGDDFARYAVELDFSTLAEGSVATVVGCRWSRPGRKRRHPAVLKVLKPDVEDRVRAELHALGDLTDYLDDRRERYDVPMFEYRETLDTVRDLLVRETHLASEQIHLNSAGRFYEHRRQVCIPKRLPFSNGQVTAMEFIEGGKVTDPAAHGAAERRALAERVLHSLISNVVFSRRDVTVFHADPHAGNLFATRDGRLAILDWALVGRLDKRQRELLAHMMWAGLTLDARRLRRAMDALAIDVRNRPDARRVIDESLAKVKKGRLPGPTWMGELFDGLLGAGVQFPADLLLFRKSLFTIKGVLNDVDPDFSIDREFLTAFARVLVREAPKRLLSLPFSREFRTQLSNLDLIRAYLNSPAILARYAAGYATP